MLATRDSVVVRISTDRLQQWFMQYPQLLLQTAKLVIRRNRSQQVRRRRVEQVSNITILPLSPHIDLTRFRGELANGMAACGKTVLLDPAIVDHELGSPGVAFVGKENPDRYRHLSAWLDKLESRNDFVVYLANPGDDAWTQRCLRQADRVLLLADAADSALPPDFETALMNGSDNGHRLQADTQLMLWHNPDTLMPVGTARWLDARPWDGFEGLRSPETSPPRPLRKEDAQAVRGGGLGARLDEARLVGHDHELNAISHTQLAEQSRDVRLDRRLAQE